MSGRLEGDVALVTGASSGIGRSIVKEYVNEGAQVALLARSRDALHNVKDSVGNPKSTLVVTADVNDVDSVRDAVSRIRERWGSVDVLVNNAGTLTRESPATLSRTDTERMIETNFEGVLSTTRITLPDLTPDGCIINVTTVATERAAENIEVYAATKGAVRTLTIQLAGRYADRGVRVNAIAPGTILTPINEQVREDKSEWKRQRRADVPLGRLGTPEDVAGPAVFLASDEASYITGHTLVVDGGGLIR